MFLVFRFLQFLCKFVILRPRGSDEEVVLSSFFCIYSHSITMTKIENRDFALIFSGKRLFNTLSKIDLSDIVIITMNFHQHLAWQMFDSKIWRHKKLDLNSWYFQGIPYDFPLLVWYAEYKKERQITMLTWYGGRTLSWTKIREPYHPSQ